MTEEALRRKEHELKGVKKQASSLLECAWLKGYVVGAEDGYRTARKKGKWEHWGSPFSDDTIVNSIVCSICKARYVEIEGEVFAFCPNCGAWMIVGDEE